MWSAVKETADNMNHYKQELPDLQSTTKCIGIHFIDISSSTKQKLNTSVFWKIYLLTYCIVEDQKNFHAVMLNIKLQPAAS